MSEIKKTLLSEQPTKRVAKEKMCQKGENDSKMKERLEAERAKLYGHLAPFDGDTTVVILDDDLAQEYIGRDDTMVYEVLNALYKLAIRHLEKEGNDLAIIRTNCHSIDMVYSARQTYVAKMEGELIPDRDIISVMTDTVSQKVAESIEKETENLQNLGVEKNVMIYRGINMSLRYLISRRRLQRCNIKQRILFITGSDLPGDTSFIKVRRLIESAKNREIVIDVYNIGGNIQPHLLRASSQTGGFYRRLSGKRDDLEFV